MVSYLQIADDPTKWWLSQPADVSHLTGPTARFEVKAPLAGLLLLSVKAASSVALVNVPVQPGTPKVVAMTAPAIYLPTAAGPSAGSAGDELPASVDLGNLANEITTLVGAGHAQPIALSSGTLVLNGASLSFVVLCPATASAPVAPPEAGGAVPHDSAGDPSPPPRPTGSPAPSGLWRRWPGTAERPGWHTSSSPSSPGASPDN